MTDPYVEFFLSAPASVVELELIEISHPDASQVFRYVRNQRGGVTVTLPVDGSTEFEYRPFGLRRLRESGDLTQGLSIDLGDPGEIMAAEMDLIALADGFSVKPSVRYWTYRSDELTVPMSGPLNYEAVTISGNGSGMSIDCRAPQRNQSGTGMLYTFARFPMLRGTI